MYGLTTLRILNDRNEIARRWHNANDPGGQLSSASVGELDQRSSYAAERAAERLVEKVPELADINPHFRVEEHGDETWVLAATHEGVLACDAFFAGRGGVVREGLFYVIGTHGASNVLHSLNSILTGAI